MRHDKTHAYRIYRFDRPLAPGARTRLDFASQVWRRGFANGRPATDLVANGKNTDIERWLKQWRDQAKIYQQQSQKYWLYR